VLPILASQTVALRPVRHRSSPGASELFCEVDGRRNVGFTLSSVCSIWVALSYDGAPGASGAGQSCRRVASGGAGNQSGLTKSFSARVPLE